MKLIVICVFIVLVLKDEAHAMSEAQYKSAAKLLRNVCQPKTKISNAQIDAFHGGDFSGGQDVMCYMECVLRTGQLTKDGKVNVDFMKSQVGGLPPSMSEPGLISAEKCKDSMKSGDKCAAAQEFYKCFYDDNPANFFLP